MKNFRHSTPSERIHAEYASMQKHPYQYMPHLFDSKKITNDYYQSLYKKFLLKKKKKNLSEQYPLTADKLKGVGFNDYSSSLLKIAFIYTNQAPPAGNNHIIYMNKDYLYFSNDAGTEMNTMSLKNTASIKLNQKMYQNLIMTLANKRPLTEENRRAVLSLAPLHYQRRYNNFDAINPWQVCPNSYYRFSNSLFFSKNRYISFNLHNSLRHDTQQYHYGRMDAPLAHCAPANTTALIQASVSKKTDLYSMVIQHRLTICQHFTSHLASYKKRIIFTNSYPNIAIYLDDLFKIFANNRQSDSFDHLFTAILSGYIDYYLHQSHLNEIECVVRSSFGYILPTVANIPTGIRLSPGLIPAEMTIPLAKATYQLIADMEKFRDIYLNKHIMVKKNSLFNKLFNDKSIKYSDFIKYFCFEEENKDNHALFVLANNFNWCKFFKKHAYLSLVKKENNPVKTIFDEVISYSNLSINQHNIIDIDKVTLYYHNQPSRHYYSSDKSFYTIVKQVLRRVDDSFLATIQKENPFDVNDLLLLLTRASERIFINSSSIDLTMLPNSDYDTNHTIIEENHAVATLFAKETLLSNGMQAICTALRVAAHFLEYSSQEDSCKKYKRVTISDLYLCPMYYEIHQVTEKNSLTQSFNQAKIIIGDVNYFTTSPNGHNPEEIIDKLDWHGKVVIIDITSTSLEKTQQLIEKFRQTKQKIALMLVASGCKLQMYGIDRNVYGMQWFFCDKTQQEAAERALHQVMNQRDTFRACDMSLTIIRYYRCLGMIPTIRTAMESLPIPQQTNKRTLNNVVKEQEKERYLPPKKKMKFTQDSSNKRSIINIDSNLLLKTPLPPSKKESSHDKDQESYSINFSPT